jgi:hypothetical protein
MSNPEIRFRQRVIALKKAKLRAQNPEWKTLWEQKLGELIRNEKTRLISL